MCVQLKKTREFGNSYNNTQNSIALWKLATGTEYRSVGHLFGVNITTVSVCSGVLCSSRNSVVTRENSLSRSEKFKEMAAYIENTLISLVYLRKLRPFGQPLPRSSVWTTPAVVVLYASVVALQFFLLVPTLFVSPMVAVSDKSLAASWKTF